jgi:ribA/ribD-fused uncharacterized protein
MIRGERFSAFTNDAPYAIRLENVTWPTVSHYLYFKKYASPVEEVRSSGPIWKLLAHAEEAGLQPHPKWEVNYDCLLLSALRAKFNQHIDLEAMLARTGDAILVYVNEHDQYLGVAENGQGQNTLGRMLMRVRREIGRPLVADYRRPTCEDTTSNGSPVIDSHRDSAQSLSDLALKYFECAEFHLARQAALRAIDSDSDCEAAQSIAAWTMIILGEYDDAIAAIKECLRLNPAEPRYYWWMSITYERLGKSIPAVIFAQRARKLEGDA